LHTARERPIDDPKLSIACGVPVCVLRDLFVGRYFYAARIRLSSYHRHCKQQRNPAGNRTELGKRPEIFSLRYGFDDCCWTCLRLGWPLRHLRFGGR
jgi:hypothetical protein